MILYFCRLKIKKKLNNSEGIFKFNKPGKRKKVNSFFAPNE